MPRSVAKPLCGPCQDILLHQTKLGAQRVIHGMVGDQALAVTDAHDAPLGPEVRVAVDPSKLHLFDARTGRRMDKRLEHIAEPAQ